MNWRDKTTVPAEDVVKALRGSYLHRYNIYISYMPIL